MEYQNIYNRLLTAMARGLNADNSFDVLFNEIDDLAKELNRPTPPPAEEPTYPCADCGKLRTKAEGGTKFTVCDECWDKHYGKPKLEKVPEENRPNYNNATFMAMAEDHVVDANKKVPLEEEAIADIVQEVTHSTVPAEDALKISKAICQHFRVGRLPEKKEK